LHWLLQAFSLQQKNIFLFYLTKYVKTKGDSKISEKCAPVMLVAMVRTLDVLAVAIP
jgi:nanoRNase/pAp phosphatase (c-di-AMP/oligoRNAs hydrolase)